MTISNENHSAPVATAFSLFALRTEAGLEFLPSMVTQSLAEPCTGEALVAEGGSYDCSVAFSLMHSEDPSAIVFRPDAVCPPSYPVQELQDALGGSTVGDDHPCENQPCGCNDGVCLTWLAAYDRVACNSVCAAESLTCTHTTWYYPARQVSAGCGDVPPPQHPVTGYDFAATTCRVRGLTATEPRRL